MVNEALARSVVSLVQSLHRATHLLTAIDPSNVAQWEGVEEADWDQLDDQLLGGVLRDLKSNFVVFLGRLIIVF